MTCSNYSCQLVYCKECFKKYILESQKDPQCMGCNSLISMEILIAVLGPSCVKTQFRACRKKLLFDRELARMSETMHAVEREINIEKLEKNIIKYRDEIRALKAMKYKEEQALQALYQLKYNNTGDNTKKKFIMPCSSETCRGFLSTQYKCGICELYTCSKCFINIGDKTENHICNENDILSAELIRSKTKPCPTCGERIEKSDGCDQMWCTQCKTAFSWRTLEIDRGKIHNPLYLEYAQRNNTAMRDPQDIPCGGIPRHVMGLINKHLSKSNKGILLYQYARNIIDIACDVRENIQSKIRRLENNEPLRIKFIRDQITEDNFCKSLGRRDHERQYLIESMNGFELITTIGIERLREIERELKNMDIKPPITEMDYNNSSTRIYEHLDVIIELDKYLIEQAKKISKIYNLKNNFIGGIIRYKI